jgi:hypothetical protein
VNGITLIATSAIHVIKALLLNINLFIVTSKVIADYSQHNRVCQSAIENRQSAMSYPFSEPDAPNRNADTRREDLFYFEILAIQRTDLSGRSFMQ